MYSIGQVVFDKKSKKPVAYLGMYQVEPPEGEKYAFDVFYYSSDGELISSKELDTTHYFITEAGILIPEVNKLTVTKNTVGSPFSFHLPDTDDEDKLAEFWKETLEKLELYLENGWISYKGDDSG